jgi:hypothetical protein
VWKRLLEPKTHRMPGMRFLFWGVEKVAGTENTQELGTQRHRQSGAPLLAPPKESGSGDGTGGRRPEGGAQKGREERSLWKKLLELEILIESRLPRRELKIQKVTA